MEDKIEPWDQRVARTIARPLAKKSVSPNHVTVACIVVCLFGSGLLASGEPLAIDLGAGVFVLGRFLDHLDGELARLSGKKSRLGYYFDYAAGGLSYAALFAGIGVGLGQGFLGAGAVALGLVGAAAAVVSLFANLGIDEADQGFAVNEGEAVGYPSLAGFELEDGIYLMAPIVWLGFLEPFFVAAVLGASAYCLWTLWRLLRLRKQWPST